MGNADDVSLLGGGCGAGFRVRTVILQPQDAIDFRDEDWSDALVVVERGELEVECCSGARAAFRDGAVITFAGLTLRRLCNAGDRPLVLTAVSRHER